MGSNNGGKLTEGEYFDSVVAARIQQGTEEDWLSAKQCLSVECWSDLTETTISSFARGHFTIFMKYLRFLPSIDQVQVLSTLLLGVTQMRLGRFVGRTQTVCSQTIRTSMFFLGYLMSHEGLPSEEQIRADTAQCGLDSTVADVVIAYNMYGTFTRAGYETNMTRPEARKTISRAQHAIEDKHPGFAAYLYNLTNDKDPDGVGQKRNTRRQRGIELKMTEPECTGQFRIKLEDPDWPRLFTSKSSMYEEEGE